MDINCPSKLTGFLKLCFLKTVCFGNVQGQISIFSPQMEAIVFRILQIPFSTHTALNIEKFLGYSPVLAGEYSHANENI